MKHWQWITARTILKSYLKLRIYSWKGTSTSYLPKVMAEIQSLAVPLICWLATQKAKGREG